MKRLLMVMLSGFLTISLTAQTLTITFNGTNRNKNYQVVLDGTSYYSNTAIDPNSTNTSVSKDITLTNQQSGEHTIAIYRQRNNGRYTNGTNTSTYGNSVYSKTFQLRKGYDMTITINGNGQVSFVENRGRNRGNRDYNQQNIPAMSEGSFNQVLQTVRTKWLQSARITTERDAFSNTANYFSTDQVKQLLLLVSSEANRLTLAKLAYLQVVDPANFTQLYNVFNNVASRNDMNTFIRNNPNTINSANNNDNWENRRNHDRDNNNNNNNNNNQYRTPMADYEFSQLQKTVNSQWNQASKYNTIMGAFNNTANYFSTTQIRQLLSEINAESERLALAKLSYARASDASSFTSLYDLFYSQTNRDDLNNFINGTTSKGTRTPMADYQFNQIVQSVNNQYYQSNKVTAIRNAISTSNTYFSVVQIRQLLSLVSAENDRLVLAKLSYLRVSDLVNFTSLYDLLNSQASRNDLNNYVIENGGTGTNVQYNTRTPMADATFSQELLKANNHFFPWDKVRDVREDFSNTSYYFSTSQIRQLLSILTSENDRLELAKLAWSRVTDPTYFTQLFDLFTSQAYRDDLNAYIQAHPF